MQSSDYKGFASKRRGVIVHAIIRPRFGADFRPPMKLAQYVKFREEKFGRVMCETRSEKGYTLNNTAAAVVRESEADVGEGEIPGRWRGRFRDGSGAMAGEAAVFVAELRQEGLVED